MTYLIIEQGTPYVSPDLPHPSFNRLSAICRTWSELTAFDGKSEFRARALSVPRYSLLSRVLARTVFNPRESIEITWEPSGAFRRGRVVALVREGLESDDDIIQQWFDAEEVLHLLESSATFDELLLAVRAICGEHETSPEVLAYVERVLGR